MIEHIVDALNENFVNLITKDFTKMQKSYQELQKISHWSVIGKDTLNRLALILFTRHWKSFLSRRERLKSAQYLGLIDVDLWTSTLF